METAVQEQLKEEAVRTAERAAQEQLKEEAVRTAGKDCGKEC